MLKYEDRNQYKKDLGTSASSPRRTETNKIAPTVQEEKVNSHPRRSLMSLKHNPTGANISRRAKGLRIKYNGRMNYSQMNLF